MSHRRKWMLCEYRGPSKSFQRWGWRNAIELLGYIAEAPRTRSDVMQRFAVKQDAAGRILRRLSGLKLIHVSGWTDRALRAIRREIYTYGDGVDVPRPPNVDGSPSRHKAVTGKTPRFGGDMIALAHVIRLMRTGPCTMAEIADETGVGRRHLSKVMLWMRQARIAYVSGYEPRLRGGSMSMLFSLGLNVDDVPRPKKRPRAFQQLRTAAARERRAHMRLLRATAGQVHQYAVAA